MKKIKNYEYWFASAKEKGFDWADLALKNTKNQGWLSTTVVFDSLRECLNSSFSWADTPQGAIFWAKIYSDLRQ